MDRGNHYEAAFEEYLRDRALPYIAVDETRRATLGDGPVKSLDFIVYGVCGARLLVDVKGRRFPGGTAAKPRNVWECWSTRGDVDGLMRWGEIFGPAYEPMFVFMYKLSEKVVLSDEMPDLWSWRGDRYLLRAVLVEDYKKNMRSRSPKWGTVGLRKDAFRDIVQPISNFTLHRPMANRREVALTS